MGPFSVERALRARPLTLPFPKPLPRGGAPPQKRRVRLRLMNKLKLPSRELFLLNHRGTRLGTPYLLTLPPTSHGAYPLVGASQRHSLSTPGTDRASFLPRRHEIGHRCILRVNAAGVSAKIAIFLAASTRNRRSVHSSGQRGKLYATGYAETPQKCVVRCR